MSLRSFHDQHLFLLETVSWRGLATSCLTEKASGCVFALIFCSVFAGWKRRQRAGAMNDLKRKDVEEGVRATGWKLRNGWLWKGWRQGMMAGQEL